MAFLLRSNLICNELVRTQVRRLREFIGVFLTKWSHSTCIVGHFKITFSTENGHGTATNNSGSFESSPRSGPSRSASLRMKSSESGPRVTFRDSQIMSREASLPSVNSEISLPESQLDWGEYLDIDGEKIMLRKKLPASCESVEDKSNGVENLASEPGVNSSSYPATVSSTAQKAQEPNIDLELDVKVLINSGKCVLHTKDPIKEEELKM